MRKVSRRRFVPTSFTLVELLTVIAIIAILVGLTLAAYSGVAKTAARSRARSEITGHLQRAGKLQERQRHLSRRLCDVPSFDSTNDPASAVRAESARCQYQDSSGLFVPGT